MKNKLKTVVKKMVKPVAITISAVGGSYALDRLINGKPFRKKYKPKDVPFDTYVDDIVLLKEEIEYKNKLLDSMEEELGTEVRKSSLKDDIIESLEEERYLLTNESISIKKESATLESRLALYHRQSGNFRKAILRTNNIIKEKEDEIARLLDVQDSLTSQVANLFKEIEKKDKIIEKLEEGLNIDSIDPDGVCQY